MITKLITFVKSRYLLYKVIKIQERLHNRSGLFINLSSDPHINETDKKTLSGWTRDLEKDIQRLNEIKTTIQKESLL